MNHNIASMMTSIRRPANPNRIFAKDNAPFPFHDPFEAGLTTTDTVRALLHEAI